MVTRKITWWSAVIALGLSSVLTSGASADTKRYLVRFKSEKTFQAMARSAKPSLWDSATGSVAPMRLFNTNASVAETFDHVGLMVIESSDARAIESLRTHPAIALVEEEILHPAPPRIASASMGAQRSPAKMDTPWGVITVKAPEAWTITRGDGARVMVLDTGLDRGHQALAGRLERGRNFTSADGEDFRDTIGHGTHVAGTILAEGLSGGLVGVAPEAKVLMGKVCMEEGCSSIAIAAGLNWAIEEKVDVVNMSLGGFFMSEGEAQAIRRAEQQGVFIAAASGNDGTGTVSYPAAADSVLAVGAVNPDLSRAEFSQWGPELDVVAPGVDILSSVPQGTGRGATVEVDLTGTGSQRIKCLPFQGSPMYEAQSLDVVFAGLGRPEDFRGLNVRGKFVLISRGEISFADKVRAAAQRGALGALIYNNAPGLMQGQLSEDGSEAAIPAVMIEQEVGESVRAVLSQGRPIRALVAVEATDYASFQGTSMAAPHVAGVAALVRAANKNLTPAEVREVLKSTARPLEPNTENEFGAGLVDAEAAVTRARELASDQLRRAAN
ncbi:MAG: S8 family serine peptidase [Bdellovibrionales bacterium]